MIYAAARALIRLVFALVFKTRVIGRAHVPLSGPLILASNHQSYMDPVFIGSGLDREIHFMARRSLFQRFFLFTWLIKGFNAFPVERDRGDVGAVREFMRRLKDGAAVVVFPEGTRTLTGEIGPLKPGAFVIAARAGANVIPTVIDGAFESWPRWRKLPRPYPVIVSYGEPIVPGSFDNDPDKMAAACADAMRALQAKSRQLRSMARQACGRE